MTAFNDLSSLTSSLFGLWALVLICVGIASAILSLVMKRYRYGVLSFALFILSFFLWQVTIALYRAEEIPVCVRFGELPWLFWLFALIILSAAASVLLICCIRYSRTNITPLEISRCADRMPCGICYWLENGHVVYSNDRMSSICTALTGRPLMNGNHFRRVVSKDTLFIDGRFWNFLCRDVESDGILLHGMIAWDVSEIHEKAEALQRDNEKLSALKEELQSYGLKIDETVRRQEILQAKINIHDETNRLMLSTVAADIENEEEMNRIFSLWERSAVLLSSEADEKKDESAAIQISELADALGVRLVWRNTFPESLTGMQQELFFTAAKEAVTNAVKHAGAKTLEIFFAENLDCIDCIFENDGSVPKGEIRFTGGLANLLVLAGEQNATVSAEIGEMFRLSLHFPK